MDEFEWRMSAGRALLTGVLYASLWLWLVPQYDDARDWYLPGLLGAGVCGALVGLVLVQIQLLLEETSDDPLPGRGCLLLLVGVPAAVALLIVAGVHYTRAIWILVAVALAMALVSGWLLRRERRSARAATQSLPDHAEHGATPRRAGK